MTRICPICAQDVDALRYLSMFKDVPRTDCVAVRVEDRLVSFHLQPIPMIILRLLNVPRTEGSLVSSDQLIAAVKFSRLNKSWDTNNLRVALHHLRDKLVQVTGLKEPLINVRLYGYYLNEEMGELSFTNTQQEKI